MHAQDVPATNLLRRLQTFPPRRHTLPTPAYSKEIAYDAMIRFLTIRHLGHTRVFRAMLSCAVLLIVFAVGVSAQQPDEVIRTDTSLVQLNVGVVDRQGRAITTLSRNDFKVYEDGVLRPIAAFEPTEAPFSLVMLLDMSGSTINFRQQISIAFCIYRKVRIVHDGFSIGHPEFIAPKFIHDASDCGCSF